MTQPRLGLSEPQTGQHLFCSEYAEFKIYGSDYGCCLFVYGTSSNHPTSRHQSSNDQKERQIRMSYRAGEVSQTAKILFPVVISVVAGLIAPVSLPLVGFLMFGNLLRECGVLDRLSITAQNELVNIISILLGLSISVKMQYEEFLKVDTLIVIGLGLVAFIMDSVGGVLFAKLLNLFRKEKVNPMIGAAGISAFPMSSRVIQKMATDEDPQNFILMHAAGANVSGQIASVIAGGLLLALLT